MGSRNVKSNNTSVPSETGSVFLLRLPMGKEGVRRPDRIPVATNQRLPFRHSPVNHCGFSCAKAVIYSNGPTFVSSAVLCKSLPLSRVTSSGSGLNKHLHVKS